MISRALYTWRDIHSVIDEISRREQIPWLQFQASPGAVEFLCGIGKRQEVLEVLAKVFEGRFADESIRLDSLPGAPRLVSVFVNEEPPSEEGLSRKRVVRPLWPDAELQPDNPPDEPARVRLAAFYSYKGGVGRTTCLLATAAELMAQGVEVLVVDADVEAPGITWYLPGTPNRLSLLDALALVHDEEDWRSAAIPLIADLLARNRESIELTSGRGSFLFLPAFRDFDQVFSPPVTLEQLVRARGRANIVGDMFVALAELMGIDAVLFDLRAGVTDFSSPLLLDPRVQSIIVTSCTEQSVRGTIESLKRILPRVQGKIPEAVLSMVPPGGEALMTQAVESLLAHLPAAEGGMVLDRPIHVFSFAQELLVYKNLEDLLLRRLPGTDLGKQVAPQLANLLVPVPQAASGSVSSERLSRPTLDKVVEEAKSSEYAESTAVQGLLPTVPLTALVDQFSTILPAAVVLGSKGAGKTFAWSQMVQAKQWRAFARLVTDDSRDFRDGLVFPLLSPRNLGVTQSQHIRNAEDRAFSTLGTTSRMTSDQLSEILERDHAEGWGDLEFWTRMIVRRLGLPEEAGESLSSLLAALEAAGKPLVLVIDGLEDAFQLSPNMPLGQEKKRLLRGLLQRLTVQVRDASSPHLGVLTFIRRDLAEESIEQNFGQFEALYQRFSLVWTPTEALRLAAWLVNRAGFVLMEEHVIPRASYEELRIALQEFWGMKMGAPTANEAYTDRWVIAALSDLQGRLQPRDIVRLIRFAAEKAREKDPSADRLTPSALKGALAQCSAEKLKELEQEVRALRPIFERFRKANPEKRTIPFQKEDFRLKDDDVVFLQRQGIVTSLGDSKELYMPEIIRQGLGFRLKEGRRAKVLALYRAAQLKNI